ncbi:MAG: XRE family transcriptional regulator [Bacteroidales bacterium]|jgi:predicted transcriptional regulator|nr:XRE family transcriptional regulator [Bacteroidales bacterium]
MMEKKQKMIDIGIKIKTVLKEKERSVSWLAKKINIDRSNLTRILNSKTMNIDLLFAVSIALDYDFFGYCSLLLHEKN